MKAVPIEGRRLILRHSRRLLRLLLEAAPTQLEADPPAPTEVDLPAPTEAAPVHTEADPPTEGRKEESKEGLSTRGVPG